MNYVNINNKKYELKDVPQDTPILWVLRDYLNMTGTKFGCGVAQCGACTVLLENKAIRSCSTPISEAFGKNITTIENKEDKELKALRIVWREHDVAQCGYCQSGQIINAAGLLKSNANPTNEEIKEAINGIPTVGINSTVTMDDDTLGVNSNGNPLSVNFGTDGGGSVVLTGITADTALGLTSSVTGNLMTISQNGVSVMTVTLNNSGGSYTYDVDQITAINHPNGLGENNIDFIVNYLVTDSSGDTVSGEFGIVVNDAVPIATAESSQDVIEGTTVTGTLDFVGGADGATVTHIGSTALTFGIDGYSQSIDIGNGSIQVKADGTYSYTAESGLVNANGVTDTVAYTVTDADGDTSIADITFKVTDGTNPGNANAITLTTNEANIDADAINTLTFTKGSDALASMAFGDITGLITDTNGDTEAGNDVTWTRTSDTVITGTIGGVTAITLTLTPNLGAGTASVKADIADNFDSILGNNGTNTLPLGNVSVVATDIDGDTAIGTVNVEVVDAVPTITVSGTATVAEDAVGTISGTWDNTNAGADEAASTVVVIGTTEYALGTNIALTEGTLNVATDGTWTFNPNTGLNNPTGADVTFSVKITDNDGDVASANHTITITDGTNPGNANAITLTTNEANIDADAINTLTFTKGSDALASMAFGDITGLITDTNGDTEAGNDVTWTRTSDTVITGTIGGVTAITLTLTPNLGAGTASVKADIADNFDSILGNNGTNTLPLGNVSVVATDIDGDTAIGTVNVEVVDAVPTITVSGTATVAEDAVGTISGTWDNTNAGADEAASTVVVIGTTEYALGTNIALTEGTLNVATDGTWTFNPNTGLNNPTGADVTFSVKITDNDGDVASANHTITITDGTNPGNANAITLTTNEANIDADAINTLTFTKGSDALASMAFGDITGLITDTNGDTEAGNDVTWTRTSDTVITGTIGGVTAITLTLTPNLGAGTASVKADIADNFDSILGNNGTNTLPLGNVGVIATDIDGDTAIGTVNVEVVDAVPTITYVTSAVTTNSAINGDFTGSWVSDVGADNNGLSQNIKIPQNINIVLNNASALGVTTTVTSFNGTSTVLTAKDALGDDYFKITVNVDGTYNFDLIKEKPASFTTEENDTSGSAGGNTTVVYLEDLLFAKNVQDTSSLKVDVKFTAHNNYSKNDDNTVTLSDVITVNTNTHGLGTGDGSIVVQQNESLTLDFLTNSSKGSSGEISKPVDSVKINFADANGESHHVLNVMVVVHYSDGTISLRENISGTEYQVAVVANKHISSVDIINISSTDDFIISGITTGFVTGVTNPPDTNLDFTLSIFDTDGDSASYSFGVGIDSTGGPTGTTSDDSILGTAGNDTISGNAGNDILDGASGNDTISGGDGNDILIGRDGNDTLTGGTGNDRLFGGNGDDTLNGGVGNDYLDGGAGVDTLNGGDGDDRLLFDKADASIDGGVGKDTLVLGSNDNIDFSALDNPIIKNIESIDLSAGNHSLTKLTLQDVIDMTDSTDKTLRITGDSGDSVQLTGTPSGSWSSTTTQTIDSVSYDVYTNSEDSSYKVLIQTPIVDTTAN